MEGSGEASIVFSVVFFCGHAIEWWNDVSSGLSLGLCNSTLPPLTPPPPCMWLARPLQNDVLRMPIPPARVGLLHQITDVKPPAQMKTCMTRDKRCTPWVFRSAPEPLCSLVTVDILAH